MLVGIGTLLAAVARTVGLVSQFWRAYLRQPSHAQRPSFLYGNARVTKFLWLNHAERPRLRMISDLTNHGFLVCACQ